MSKRFKSPEMRNLMVLTLAMDPSVRLILRQFLSMRVYNIRHDTMLVRQPDNTYMRQPDPSAWNADLDAFGGKNNMGVCMLRTRDGEWFLNGQ